MGKRIEEDHDLFRNKYSDRIKKGMKKFINNGKIFRTKPDGTRVPITVPRLDIPHIVHGTNDKGVGRGDGKDGDVLRKGQPQGKGNKAGDGTGDGIEINVDLDVIWKEIGEELKLPDLKPKPNETFEEEEIKYTSISLTGPESLRHNRRTLMQALKRSAASGQANKLHFITGSKEPMRMVTPINSDKRYRQYKIVKKPTSNAVIFFARDGSGSMDDEKCDIVSDMSWWIDLWIRRFYDRVERCYIWHDSEAKEVDEKTFYNYRHGGGTRCSSAIKLIAEQFGDRFPPNKWNFYIFYFTDGDNWGDDVKKMLETIEEKFTPEVVNLFGVTQVLCNDYDGSVLNAISEALGSMPNLRMAEIGHNVPYGSSLSEDERDLQVKNAIVTLLGNKKKASSF